jgi:hypothetical protein
MEVQLMPSGRSPGSRNRTTDRGELGAHASRKPRITSPAAYVMDGSDGSPSMTKHPAPKHHVAYMKDGIPTAKDIDRIRDTYERTVDIAGPLGDDLRMGACVGRSGIKGHLSKNRT